MHNNTIDDIMATLPPDAKELFFNNATFNVSIFSLKHGNNPAHIIYELCKSLSHYQKLYEKHVEKYGI